MFRPPGQKRASAPKVRTGCLTCKTRRVKCDETKPRCKQCTKSLRECQWKRGTKPTTSRVLVPLVTSRKAPLPPAGLVKPPSQTLPFENNQEIQYLRAYQDVVHRELAGALRISPWFDSVMQACHTEPSILRAVVAIGALNKSWKLAHFASHGPSAMKIINVRAADSHREFALLSYSKALTGLRRLTLNASQPVNLRHILIGSLLVHCMEIFLQSPESAFQHSAAGYSLLLDWIAANKDSTRSYKWTSSPNTAVIEDSIFHEHVRLQNDRALSPFSPPLSYHQAARQKGEAAVLEMPKEFMTLEEAQDHCELLMHRTTHLIAEIRATITQTHVLLSHPLASDLPGHITDLCDLPHMRHLYPLQASYLAELYAWKSSFAPLLARLSLTNDTRLVVGSAIQQNHVLNAIATLATSLETSEMIYEQHYNIHSEIIALIVRSMKITPHVTADLRPVFQITSSFHLPIANVAADCREKALREQAIAIMIRMSPRDGDMARQRMVFSHKYLLALEELNRTSSGDVSENLRYRIIGTYTHGKDDVCTTVVMRKAHPGPRANIYPSTKRYRWKTWTREQAAAFEVGDLVSDLDGEDVVDHEREIEMKKWPRGLAKPAWIQWWQVFHELPKSVKDRKLRSVLDLPTPVSTTQEEVEEEEANEWIDISEKEPVRTVNPQQLIVEQIGAGFGAWVPHLNVFSDQDLDAIHRGIYQR